MHAVCVVGCAGQGCVHECGVCACVGVSRRVDVVCCVYLWGVWGVCMRVVCVCVCRGVCAPCVCCVYVVHAVCVCRSVCVWEGARRMCVCVVCRGGVHAVCVRVVHECSVCVLCVGGVCTPCVCEGCARV